MPIKHQSNRARKGEPLRFLTEVALSYSANDCLNWPFAKTVRGYGRVTHAGRVRWVHRVVCTLAHGAPAALRLDAAHSCGNNSCVNPRHLRWATRAENEADKLAHGTRVRGERVASAKLVADEVHFIRESEGRLSVSDIVRMLPISQQTVRNIRQRLRWAWLSPRT